jgi:hypothetical protein
VVCDDDQRGTVAAMTGLAVGAAIFLALAVWQPLVDVWSCLPSGAAERALGEWEALQVHQRPNHEIRNPKHEPREGKTKRETRIPQEWYEQAVGIYETISKS